MAGPGPVDRGAEPRSIGQDGGQAVARCVGALLKAQAAARPRAVAIAAPGRQPLSYGGLLGHVGSVVEALNGLGIGRGDRVAVVLPNGPEMATAFVAIAAGAVCAPINPADQADAMEFAIADLGTKAIVVPAGGSGPAVGVAAKLGIPLLALTPLAEAEAGRFTLAGERLPGAARPGWGEADELGLVLHTSGTTARPKIVPLSHRNIVSSAFHTQRSLALDERDLCLNVMPLFHIHGLIGAVLASLSAGGGVACTSGFNVEAFGGWLEALRPTWYTAVPTIHQAVLDNATRAGAATVQSSLRFIRSGSASLPKPVLQGLEQVYGVPVIESYGMTEAAHQMASNPLPPRARKIGSVGVAAGPAVAIMDEAGTLLAAKGLGEVVIRGEDVMAGYQNNPAANAADFTQGWFRTGDQGYLDEDGYLFLTGRLKEIINRGGEKIAPGEVDAVLLADPAVAQAVTFAVPHPTLGEDVAAAVVLRPGATATDRDIRHFAAGHLATFKVPSRILILPELPHGPTGKLQRIGLAERLGLTAHAATSEAQVMAEVRSPLEEALARIWAEVLRLPRVGIHDNFLELGGDSIEATQIVARVRDELGLNVSLDTLLDEPTVAEQAQAIEEHREASVPRIPRRAAPGPAPLSFGQERVLGIVREAPAAANRPENLQLQGPLDAEALCRALNEIVRRHEVLRTRYPVVGGAPVQWVAPGLSLELPVVDLSARASAEQDAELRRLATAEGERPFDLARGPVVRASLVRLAAERHVLLLTFNHIAFDGWSTGVLLRELAALYPAFVEGQASPLAELPIQFADYAAWQRQMVASRALDDQVAYWREQLGGGLPVPELPTDYPRPAGPAGAGAPLSRVLPRQVADALRELSRREGVTRFMTLLAAYAALMHRYSGQDVVVVRSPIAGRTHHELEGMIGFFMNTLILRTDLAGDPTFVELLGRVRKETLGAYTHQDLPFEALLPDLPAALHVERPGLLGLSFQLRNVGESGIAAGPLQIQQVEFPTDESKFDLYLETEEVPDGLSCLFVYRTDLFKRETMTAMMDRLQTVLEGIATAPERRLSELPF